MSDEDFSLEKIRNLHNYKLFHNNTIFKFNSVSEHLDYISIDTKSKKDEEHHSITQIEDNLISIWINPINNEFEKRFHVANSIGHAYYHFKNKKEDNLYKEKNQLILEESISPTCKYAINFLLPVKIFAHKISDIISLSIETNQDFTESEYIDYLSYEFRLPSNIIRYRMKELKYI